MIKAVIFDFGQTLVDSSAGFKAAEKDAQRKLLAAFAPADEDAFRDYYRQARADFHGRSAFSRPALWRAILAHHGWRIDEAALESWEREYWAMVRAHTVIFPEVVGVLTKLQAAYRLAMITNTQGERTEGRHRLSYYPELRKLFEIVIVAGEGGLPPKPDPAPFRACLRALGLEPGQAAFVGDDYRLDVDGARAVGLKPIWLKHRLVERRWPDVIPACPVIAGLEELLRPGLLDGPV